MKPLTDIYYQLSIYIINVRQKKANKPGIDFRTLTGIFWERSLNH